MSLSNLFKRIGNHVSVTRQLIDVAIKADDLARNTVLIPVAVNREDLTSLRNDLLKLANGDDITVTPDDKRMAALEAAIKFFKL